MSECSPKWMARRLDCGTLCCAVSLMGMMGVALILACPIAFYSQGAAGIAAAAVAALFCTVTGIAALAVTLINDDQHPTSALVRMLLAMAIRIIPPLTVCLVIAMNGGADTLHGFIYYLLVFYLLSLAVETYLTVRRLKPASNAPSLSNL